MKLDVAHDQLPVVFICDGAGFVYSHLGTSHQSTEDIACTRAIPHLSIYSPADRFEVAACMELAYQSKSAVYLRMGKSDRGDVHPSMPDVKVGSLLKIKEVSEQGGISFIATGSMTRAAQRIAENAFPSASVWSAPFIKPIDAEQVISICKESQVLVVLEEHSTLAGLGSVIAEIASQFAPIKILRIGTNDRFSHYCGTYDYLLKEHGLDEPSVIQKIHTYLALN
jgi:transketolase